MRSSSVFVLSVVFGLTYACSSSGPSPGHPVASPSAEPSSAATPVATEPTPVPVAPAPASAHVVAAPASLPNAPVVDLTVALKDTPFAPGIQPIKDEKWAEARAILEALSPTKLPHVPKHVGMAVLALRGRCHGKLSQKHEAEVTYQKVLYRLIEPESGGASTSAPGDKDINSLTSPQKISASAEGEARYQLADYKRLEADALVVPRPAGPMDRAAFDKYVKTRVTDWVKKKKNAIDEAEKGYAKILEIQPEPPPSWVIAASERDATMWWRFVQDLRSLPTPSDWDKAPDVKEAYTSQIAEISAPMLERARLSYEACKKKSELWGAVPPHSQTCFDWVTANPK